MNGELPYGVRTLKQTLVIPQHRNDMGTGAPPPVTRPDLPNVLPAGYLRGTDTTGTVLVFTGVSGQLIKTEYYNTGRAGNFWNANNTYPPGTNHKAISLPTVSDFTVDGRANPFHWVDQQGWVPTKPYAAGRDDPTNIEHQPLAGFADGVCMQGLGHRASRLRLYQISGTALRILGGVEAPSEQAGPWSIFDDWGTHLDNINVTQCYNGIAFNMSDSTAENIFIDSCANDGLIFQSSGGMLSHSHVAGCGHRAFVFTYPSKARMIYADASRIGVHIQANSVEIDGLELGSLCWERGIVVDGHYATLTGVTGRVAADRNPPAVVIACGPGTVGHLIRAKIDTNGNETGLAIDSNHRSDIRLRGDAAGASTFAKVRGAPLSTRVEISGLALSGGASMLDFSESTYDKLGGGGSVYRLWGNCRPRYPGFGTPANPANKFNLQPGTRVYVNDELES